MKKIAFSFQQAGGVNAFLPLIEKWNSTYDILLTGSKFVCEHLKNNGISEACNYTELGLQPGADETGSMWFEKIKPDVVITDTIDLMRTSDGIACRDFWLLAKKFHIPSIAYVDCWWGYDKRFLLPGETTPMVLPNYIAVIDNYAKNDLVNNGYSLDRINVLGSPRFEFLYRSAQNDNKKNNVDEKKRMGLKQDDFFILFVSQPLEKVFGSSDLYGFTERTTFSAIIDVLLKFSKELRNRLSIVVLLHPEEDESILRAVVKKKKVKDISIIFRKEDKPVKLLIAADLVLGMSSILLAEAVILNRPVLSIQLDLKREEILITNIIEATLSINSYEQLSNELFKSLTDASYRDALVKRQEKFDVIKNSFYRWNSMIKKLLMLNIILKEECTYEMYNEQRAVFTS